MHSVFYHGTIEWRLFNSTLHAGEAKANIILAMAISAQGINQKYTQFRKTPIGDNPAFTFRTFLLRLGLIGPEYKNVRMHLLKNLPGDKAWRHDKSLYPSNQPRLHTDEVLIALSASAATNPQARLALSQLPELAGCQAHTSVMLSDVDIKIFKKLEVQLTSEAVYEHAL